MKADQLTVKKEDVEKAVHTKQTDLDGKVVPEMQELQCPFIMATCIRERCRMWSHKFQMCNLETLAELLFDVREIEELVRKH